MDTCNQTAPNKKRRRLNRKRRSKANHHHPHESSSSKGGVPILEDTTFRLLVERDPIIKRKKSRTERSLPILLMERQTGLWMMTNNNNKSVNGMTRWQERMIQQQQQPQRKRDVSSASSIITVNNKRGPSPVWRPFAKLELSFRQLQTPVSDVVVGFDVPGDHIIALGGRLHVRVSATEQPEQPPFFLRFYGLPSKLKALGVTRGTRPLLERSTPVMTIPIDFSRRTTQSRGSSFLPATIPTTIALSADGDLGLAYTEIRSLNEISALTLFQTPRVLSKSASSSVFSIQIPGLLFCWFGRTSFLPSLDEGNRTGTSSRSCLWSEEYNVPGHVVFLQCKDSFRLVWVRSWELRTPQPCPDQSIWAHDSWRETMLHSDNPFVSISMQNEPQWETKMFDCATGSICTENGRYRRDGVGLEISFEVVLNFRAFAENLFQRFEQLFDFSDKDRFDVRFVDQRSGFRAVEVLISWPKISGEGGLAAFVLIDMRSGDYKVLRWIRERPEVFDNESYAALLLLRWRRSKISMVGIWDSHDDSVWDFLESPLKDENDTDADKPYFYWMPKIEHPHPTCYSPCGKFFMNNSAVLNEVPIESMEHAWAPVSLRYE